MAFSLRLPPALDNQARIRAEQLGVPLNAVICFALDLYLRGGASGQPSNVVDALDMVNPRRLSRGGTPLKVSSAEGLAAKMREKPSTAVLQLNGLPPGIGSSKAERRAFTENQRLLRKQK